MKNEKDVLILAIESSCDETAAAVVKNGREVLSNIISSQIALHTLYGGVVPEIVGWVGYHVPEDGDHVGLRVRHGADETGIVLAEAHAVQVREDGDAEAVKLRWEIVEPRVVFGCFEGEAAVQNDAGSQHDGRSRRGELTVHWHLRDETYLF